jgi:FixJ family two-component response regulator
VVFVTGYGPGIAEDLRQCVVVEKPFTSADLVAAVLAALAARDEPRASAQH